MAHLEAANGPLSGTQYQLDQDGVRMGRHPDCEVLVDSGGSVSRFHAEISQRPDGLYVQDSNSRNGTFVNGQMIHRPERLYDDDLIQICDLVFVFHDETSKRPAPKEKFPIPAVLISDDAKQSQSSIMSRLEVSSTGRMVHVRASADAKLRAMMELSDSLANALSVDDVLSPVLDSLFKVFLQADNGFIVLRKSDEEWEPRCAKFRRPGDQQVRISRSIVNHVMDNHEAILSADAADDSRFDMSESIASFRIRSFVCAPLIDTEGRVLGAIQIDAVDSQDKFTEEDLELIVSVSSQAAIAIQRATLHDQAMKVREMQAELDLARQVQLQLLPDEKPDIQGYSFFDYYRAANQIGGDYYDYVVLPDGRLAAILADVSGHGIAAAMVMAKLAAEARFCLATIEKPKDVVTRLNDLLYADQVENRFVTLVLLVLNPSTNELVVVNAGHSSPLWRTSDGQVISLPRDNAGPLLGVIEGAEYAHEVVRLKPGDILTVFTDGIIEAMQADGSQYGEPRLVEQLVPAAEGVAEFGKRVIDDVQSYIGTGDQTDDICMICLQRQSA